jgi:hypothetical protein
MKRRHARRAIPEEVHPHIHKGATRRSPWRTGITAPKLACGARMPRAGAACAAEGMDALLPIVSFGGDGTGRRRGLTIRSEGPSSGLTTAFSASEAAVGAVEAFDATYRLRGGGFTSGGSRLWSSLPCASVGSGSSKNASHMIQAASGTRAGSFMNVPTRLCALRGRFATPSDAGWGIEAFANRPGWLPVGVRRAGSPWQRRV